ncbi:MAG: N-acyl homoserine lactone hydrolase [Nocardioidaceae bacterium]|nr:N-acyl homoserine lactone hydrolase [Nocardioidaceae bacterium]
MQLGFSACDLELLAFPHPELVLTARRQTAEKTWYHCPLVSFIIDHPDGLILWETGAAPTAAEEWPKDWQEVVDLGGVTPENSLERKLASLGLGPEDFRYVILGHLHSDHAGGLRLFEDAGATIIVHEDEYRHVTQIADAADFFVRKDWHFLGAKAPTTVYGDQEILRGVSTVSLPGHTPGTMGLKLELPHTGTLLLTSDALSTHWNYGSPAVGSPINWDDDRWRRSIEKIRRIASAENALLVPGHDLQGFRHEGAAFGLESIRYSPDYVYE